MDVKAAIQARRAYRSFEAVEISDGLIRDLAECAGLAPSCYNKQPWRFIFVRSPDMLLRMHQTLSKGNQWAHGASMIVAVLTRRDLDCIIPDGREYCLFDTGLAASLLMLRATELGLVAHPIAGYDPAKVRQVLNIPEDMSVITLINVGKHSAAVAPGLSDWQVKQEQERPARQPFEQYAWIDTYTP